MFDFLCKDVRNRGAVTIFLCIILVPFLAFSSLMIELGRYQSTKQMLESDMDVANESVAANYNSSLYKQFGLLAMDGTDDTMLKKEFLKSFAVNSNSGLKGKVGDTNQLLSILYTYEDSDVDVSGIYSLADLDVLNRQIQEYSKYRGPVDVFEDVIDLKSIKENLVKLIGEKILGEKGLKAYQKITKQLNELLKFADNLYNLQVAIGNCTTSIKGSSVWQDVIAGTQELLWDDSPIETPDTYYTLAKKNLEKAYSDKKKYCNDNNIDYDGILSCAGSTMSEKYVNYFDKKEEQEVEKYTKLYRVIEVIWGCGGNRSDHRNDRFDSVEGDLGNWTIGDLIDQVFPDMLETDKNQFSENLASMGVSLTSKMSRLIVEINNKRTEYKKEIGSVPQIKNGNDFANIHRLQNKISNRINEGETYNQRKINELNRLDTEISNAFEKLKGALTTVKSKLGTYLEKLKKLTENINTGCLDDVTDLFADTAGLNIAKVSQILSKNYENIAQTGMQNIQNELDKYETYNLYRGISIDSVGSFISGNELIKYYMSWTEAVALSGGLQTIKFVSDDDSESSGFLKKLIKAWKTVNPIPKVFTGNHNQVLSAETLETLPSHTDNSEDTSKVTSDAVKVDAILREVKRFVPPEYANSIDALSSNSREYENSLWATIGVKIEEIQTCMDAIRSEYKGGFSININILSAIRKLRVLLTNLLKIIENMIFVFSHASELLQSLIDNIKEMFYINYYATSKLSNRLSASKDSMYQGEGFNAADLEYVLEGKSSEIENESIVFGKIFFIRLILNIIPMVTDPTVVETLAALNIADVIAVPVWLYLETNLDMNVMIRLGKGIRLIKDKMFFSPTSIHALMDIVAEWDEISSDAILNKKENDAMRENSYSQISQYTSKVNDNLTGGISEKDKSILDKLFEFTYLDYCNLFLCLKTSKTKLSRIADVIQMNVRYSEKLKGKKGDFLMNKAFTYVRSSVEVEQHTFFPIISLGSGGSHKSITSLKGVDYCGY